MHQRKCAVSGEAQPEAGPGEGEGGNVDRVLYKDLVEMVPLIETLMDRRGKPSYSRRAPIVHTPAPAPAKKGADLRGGKSAGSASAKKRRDSGDNANGLNTTTSASDRIQNDKELCVLQSQLEDLQKQLLEKEEFLRSAESSVRQLDELKHELAVKDALMKSATNELNSLKIMLADKQASVEKLEWEVKVLHKKNEDLEGDISSMDFERSALMILFDKLIESDSASCQSDSNAMMYEVEPIHLPNAIDDLDVKKVEQEVVAYTAAISAARKNPDEEWFAAAREARLKLQSVVL